MGTAIATMKNTVVRIVPMAGTPDEGIAVGCVALPKGPQVAIVLSTGSQALCGLMVRAELDDVIEQLTAARDRADAMPLPQHEPEVRRS